MERFRAIFQGVDDPRKSNATKHDLIEMLVIALLAAPSGKSSCSSFARYARVNCEFLKGFLELKGGPPSHDAFSEMKCRIVLTSVMVSMRLLLLPLSADNRLRQE